MEDIAFETELDLFKQDTERAAQAKMWSCDMLRLQVFWEQRRPVFTCKAITTSSQNTLEGRMHHFKSDWSADP
jgi:hypothetical protein